MKTAVEPFLKNNTTKKPLNQNRMKIYHLTILRNGKHKTIMGHFSSITSFLIIEKELGHETLVIYSREINTDELEMWWASKPKEN
jgi:hypothetical protein